MRGAIPRRETICEARVDKAYISIHPKSVFKGTGTGECTRFYYKEAVTRLTDVEQLIQLGINTRKSSDR